MLFVGAVIFSKCSMDSPTCFVCVEPPLHLYGVSLVILWTEKSLYRSTEFFEHRCAYCGMPDTGDTRNGLVPACHHCNDRRGKKPWEMWLRQSYPADAEIRVKTIIRYLQQYPYKHPEKPETRLTEEEWKEYESIMSELGIQKLRSFSFHLR
jgi:hypothetical protein